jgi:hypothetical protein
MTLLIEEEICLALDDSLTHLHVFAIAAPAQSWPSVICRTSHFTPMYTSRHNACPSDMGHEEEEEEDYIRAA